MVVPNEITDLNVLEYNSLYILEYTMSEGAGSQLPVRTVPYHYNSSLTLGIAVTATGHRTHLMS